MLFVVLVSDQIWQLKLLAKNGFTKVYNVLPGMTEWNGKLTKKYWRNFIMSNKVAIIASNGGLFDAYKVFNIATAAAATEKEVAIFFTFEGLNLIHKQECMHFDARRTRAYC